MARLCRRICVLRERGDAVEAARLESEPLAELIASLHAAGESEAAVQQRVAALFAVEEERVADAAVLAELLLPALQGRMAITSQEPARNHISDTPRPAFVAAVPPAPVPRKRSTDIATFIDEMLEQEDAATRRAS